ncbi:geranylgeranyl reductase family protein [Candidatus Bathyarchaeota archaeon]|nr:geranylgeranyl reductase family protein [Candidatus Bathyarchaeota archaeon]
MECEERDILVIGAGPGGSIAARTTAASGLDVLLVDRHEFPRYKCCAAGVLWHNIEDFPEIKPVIENYNHRMVVHSPSLDRKFEVVSTDDYLLGQTYRSTLDEHLAKLAVASGAEFRDAHSVKEIKFLPDATGAIVTIMDKASSEEHDVKVKLVIDASGVSAVSRKMHPRLTTWNRENMLMASELDVSMDSDEITSRLGEERTVHIFLYFNDLPGYAWIFTKEHSVSVGMGTMLEFKGKMLKGKQLASNFKEYCSFLEQEGYIKPGSCDTSKTRYALIPSMSIKEGTTFADNVLLVGDAAGVFVSALSGEGIYYAMLSGRFAGRTACDAFKKGKMDAKTLSSYRNAWQKRLKSELNYQYFARNYMLFEKRRCEKAIRWGLKDKAIRKFLRVFFTGRYKINRWFALRLVGHYIRLKIKDALGMLGEREKREDYK